MLTEKQIMEILEKAGKARNFQGSIHAEDLKQEPDSLLESYRVIECYSDSYEQLGSFFDKENAEFYISANPSTVSQLCRMALMVPVLVESLKEIAENKKIEEQEHWEWGNADDSYSHGYEVGQGYLGEVARAALNKTGELEK